MLIVGLTGGIGSGKTAASDYFKVLGIDVIDADLASRVVVEPGQPALAAIAEHFGSDVLLANGELNRAALREKIFTDPQQKQWLESLLHPLIGAEIDRQLAAVTSPYALFVSPLLLETQQSGRCDRIIVVDVDVDTQVKRATSRDNNSEAMIRNIINSQMSRADRLSRADDIVTNSGSLAELHQQIDRLHQRYLKLI